MRTDKQLALKLRMGGKSYGEIGKILRIPKSTLSAWFSRLVLSDPSRERIEARGRKKSTAALMKHNKRQTTLAITRATEARREGAKHIGKISRRDLLLLGTCLYWAEGYKRPIRRFGRELTSHTVSLTNSDPALVRAFIRFLREYCSVPIARIKINVRVFPNQNAGELVRFWKSATALPDINLSWRYTGISKSSMGKRPYNRLPHGVVQLVVANTHLFHKIMGHIEGLKCFV